MASLGLWLSRPGLRAAGGGREWGHLDVCSVAERGNPFSSVGIFEDLLCIRQNPRCWEQQDGQTQC